MVEFSIAQLDRFMQNIGSQQFTYDVFKAAYDSDSRIKDLVKDFNQDTINLKTSEMDDVKSVNKQSQNNVAKMAKRATNVGDNL